jgi:hypothetical protein
MMFDLKIQTAQEPTLHSTASSEIQSSFDLDGPAQAFSIEPEFPDGKGNSASSTQ